MSQLNLFNNVEAFPPDALFNIGQRYQKDSRDKKVDLGIGAYRDDNGKPWVLPSVKLSETKLHNDPSFNHEYMPILGFKKFTTGAGKVMFDTKFIEKESLSNRLISVQSVSGTGALHLAAKFLSTFLPGRKIYLSDPTWANHKAIFEGVNLITSTYPYWDPETKSLRFESFIQAIKDAKEGSVFVLHACAHNPTGLDPSKGQWKEIINEIKLKNHIVLFDSAYQGFASGSLVNDAFAVRLGVQELRNVAPVFVCQSFAKNVGMYGERVGCCHLVLPDTESNIKARDSVESQFAKIIRTEISTSPCYGAKIVATILEDPKLTAQWHEDMVTMSSRISLMRHKLRDFLVELKTPGNWDHIVEQCGMFSFTGLTPEMVERLEINHAVYMAKNGRASIAGLNEHNVRYTAEAIDEVVRHFQTQSRL
ncbi:hypothetical protein KAFR_0D02850 [Kazachstania africana CBS 2517]|uniref:Aspartate aminotransferase n=1 Tax=Kazachstania africana (strain ATCC 22294 / BCRC 22015 / CBS 2517 / CECT 1963 / NBRC 1671 / NRRL Y-8276) TaxID=1071382 RepID=H2AU83_KAZAF|nr:hypothetical protein KAFR_0D02850 [Kazachstania africana CBS 2517]CCF57933.1 hypothetical protein KAFR_0D02850 [Kazachstania africana CBS 2517]